MPHDPSSPPPGGITRRSLLAAGGAAATVAALPGTARAAAPEAVAPGLVETSISELRDRLRSGQTTSVALVQGYRSRIAAIDNGGPKVNAIIEQNPDALDIARRLDAERAAGTVRGPLHGIPVLIKDNIATGDGMQTTAGSLALVGCQPDRDATVAARLRQAGAILLAKTNLSEWANFRGNGSSSGWSGRGGLTHNPYILDRSASGSSSGSAAGTAASLAAVALGTETDGSILSPSAACGLVGIKPTVGLTSRAGVIPISHSQDTVGPMGRTVTDAAITLGALVGPDPRDPATAESAGRFFRDYTRFLNPGALKGARIGVPRRGFWGVDDVTDAVTEQALRTMRDLGATLVDAEFPDLDEISASNAEITVLLYEFKQDVKAYLESLPLRKGCPRDLADLIEFNREHAAQELQYFGQQTFLASQQTDGLADPVYKKALAEERRLGRGAGAGPGRQDQPQRRRAHPERLHHQRHRDRRLPRRHRPHGLRPGTAGRAVLLRHRVQRADADLVRLRLRAGDPRAAGAALPRHRRAGRLGAHSRSGREGRDGCGLTGRGYSPACTGPTVSSWTDGSAQVLPGAATNVAAVESGG